MSAQAKEYDLPLEVYKSLIGLLEHEEALFWRRNEVFLALNGGLVAILGLVWPSESATFNPMVRVFIFLICAIGVLVSPLWLIVVRRSEAFYNCWYEHLKFLEKQYLAPIDVLQSADKFFAEGRVMLGAEEIKLDRISSRMRIYHALIALPLVFLAAWVGLIVYLILLA